MAWTTQEMKKIGEASTNVKTIKTLITSLENLPDEVYQRVIGDDGETIDRAILLVGELKSEVQRLEEIKLKEYNEATNPSN
jgi:ribosome biogenesis SPOUT family RNA methylase Rps3